MKVIKLHQGPCYCVMEGLRNLADMIERGEINPTTMTCCDGGTLWHFGSPNDIEAARDMCWNLTQAQHNLMAPRGD